MAFFSQLQVYSSQFQTQNLHLAIVKFTSCNSVWFVFFWHRMKNIVMILICKSEFISPKYYFFVKIARNKLCILTKTQNCERKIL